MPGGVCRVWQAQRSDSGSEDMLGMGGGRGGRGGQGGESGNSRGQSAGHGDCPAESACHARFLRMAHAAGAVGVLWLAHPRGQPFFFIFFLL